MSFAEPKQKRIKMDPASPVNEGRGRRFGFGSVCKTGDPGVFRYVNGSYKANYVTVDSYDFFPLKTKKQAAYLK